MQTHRPYIPRTIGEVWDQLGFIFLKSPTFEDPAFPGQNIDTVFWQLNEGLAAVRHKLGSERYHLLLDLSARARAHFAADPEDSNGQARAGRELVREMEAIVLQEP
jgi:hypothetical protein